MKSPLSPSDIEVLLHCLVSPASHPRHDAPAVQGALAMFVKADMLTYTHTDNQTGRHVYGTTSKGDAFIEAILNTPEPVQTWTVPTRKED